MSGRQALPLKSSPNNTPINPVVYLGRCPQEIVDAADPDVHPGRPADLLHGGGGDSVKIGGKTRIGFWEAAGQRLDWQTPFTTVHSWADATSLDRKQGAEKQA